MKEKKKKEILANILRNTGQRLPLKTKFTEEGNYHKATLPGGKVIYFTPDWGAGTGEPKECLSFEEEGCLMKFVRGDGMVRYYKLTLDYFSDWGPWASVKIRRGKIYLKPVPFDMEFKPAS